MLEESSNNQNNNSYSETTNISQKNIVCKDGFCSLSNHKDISKRDDNDTNIFEPI